MRIFVSSPGDVLDERRRAAAVIERVGRHFAKEARLIPVLWEDAPLRATGSFQEGIDEQVKLAEIDLVVFILWSRLGTPLGGTYSKDGRAPTGTEWEFEQALAAHRQRKSPDLLVYRRTSEPALPSIQKDSKGFEEATRPVEGRRGLLPTLVPRRRRIVHGRLQDVRRPRRLRAELRTPPAGARRAAVGASRRRGAGMDRGALPRPARLRRRARAHLLRACQGHVRGPAGPPGAGRSRPGVPPDPGREWRRQVVPRARGRAREASPTLRRGARGRARLRRARGVPAGGRRHAVRESRCGVDGPEGVRGRSRE